MVHDRPVSIAQAANIVQKTLPHLAAEIVVPSLPALAGMFADFVILQLVRGGSLVRSPLPPTGVIILHRANGEERQQRRTRNSDASSQPEHRRGPGARLNHRVRRTAADAEYARRGGDVEHSGQSVELFRCHCAPFASEGDRQLTFPACAETLPSMWPAARRSLPHAAAFAVAEHSHAKEPRIRRSVNSAGAAQGAASSSATATAKARAPCGKFPPSDRHTLNLVIRGGHYLAGAKSLWTTF